MCLAKSLIGKFRNEKNATEEKNLPVIFFEN